jgi:uncharacterized protein YacL
VLPELKKIFIAVVLTALAGAILGLILAALATDFLSLDFFIWIAVAAFLGANLGLVFAYGFLPES